MRKLLFFKLIILGIVYFPAINNMSAQEKSWTWIGPNQFYTKSITISPPHPNIIFISDGSRVLKSVDYGNNWRTLPDFSSCGSIGALAIDPADYNTVFALDYTGG